MSVSEVQTLTPMNEVKPVDTTKNETKVIVVKTQDLPKDSVTITAKEKAPEIAFPRVLFSYLSDEQIKAINETGYLPANAKFVPNNSENGCTTGYHITYNIFNVTNGTRKLPEGYELQRDVFGFTNVVPKETEGLFLRKSQ